MKKTLLISLLLTGIALLIMLYGLRVPKQDNVKVAISEHYLLLSEKGTGSFYLQLRQGAEAAANEKSAIVDLENMQSWNYSELASKIKAKKFSGVIIYAENEALIPNMIALAKSANTPYVTVLWNNQEVNNLQMDDFQAGVLLGEMVKGYDEIIIEGNNPERLEGLKSVFSNVIVNDASAITEKNIAYVGLSADATQDIIENYSGDCYGMDGGKNRSELLAQGKVKGLVCISPYSLGFEAIQAFESKKAIKVSYHAVLQEEMYDAKNIKLVFPMLQ